MKYYLLCDENNTELIKTDILVNDSIKEDLFISLLKEGKYTQALDKIMFNIESCGCLIIELNEKTYNKLNEPNEIFESITNYKSYCKQKMLDKI